METGGAGAGVMMMMMIWSSIHSVVRGEEKGIGKREAKHKGSIY